MTMTTIMRGTVKMKKIYTLHQDAITKLRLRVLTLLMIRKSTKGLYLTRRQLSKKNRCKVQSRKELNLTWLPLATLSGP